MFVLRSKRRKQPPHNLLSISFGSYLTALHVEKSPAGLLSCCLKSAQSLKSDSFDLLSSSRGDVLQRSAGRNQCKQPKYQRNINVIMVFSCTPPVTGGAGGGRRRGEGGGGRDFNVSIVSKSFHASDCLYNLSRNKEPLKVSICQREDTELRFKCANKVINVPFNFTPPKSQIRHPVRYEQTSYLQLQWLFSPVTLNSVRKQGQTSPIVYFYF